MRWSDISFSPTTLRQFSAIWIVFFAALALWYGLYQGHTTVGVILAILAITVGPVGLLRPGVIKPIYTIWMAAVFPIGWLVSFLMLAVVYFAVVTPVAVAFRLLKRDALQRRSPPSDSYWQSKPMPDNMGRYLRQY
jgi:hypothetical protein